MNPSAHDVHIALAQDHVRDGEARVLRQMQLVADLENRQLHDVAAKARELLAVLTETLGIMRVHLAMEARRLPGPGRP
jgi:hypothetical protein